ncbi:MAG: HEAT repeat domain-containing protein [Thermoguttaceae bacterium]
MYRSTRVLCAALLLLALVQPAVGEVFLLRGGGRIEGDLVNVDEKPRKSYVISLSNGGQVTLDAAVVEKMQPLPPELAEYAKVRRQYPDTVQGQLQMADWCRDHNLTAQRKAHLERVLQLDPEQADARRLLNYTKVKDKWMTLEEKMADQGKVKRDGRWITRQEAELHDSRDKQHKAESEWRGKISSWRKWLDGTRPDQGEKKLRTIDDPMAIAGLADWLKKDPRVDARLIYVEVLARMNMHEARGPLAKCAIDDDVAEVRLSCLDELEKQKDDAVTDYFVRRMRDKHTTNQVINRAGVALGRMKDPSCVDTLIEYLVTGHDEVIQPAGGPGSMTPTFSKNGGGGGMSMNQKPVTITRYLQNQGVLDALVAITGQDFGFDFRAWHTWYTNQKLKGAPVEAKTK